MRSAAMPLRALRLAAASLPVVAAFTVVGAASRVGPAVGGCAQASSAHHAALVVEHGNGAVIRVCVSFTAASITGDQVLALSNVQYATADYGGTGKAVCQIAGEPAHYPPGCWTASSPYWAMFVSRAGGSWLSSGLGISSQTFSDGDAEGFRYEGQSDSSVPPSPGGVCPARISPTPPPVNPTAIPQGTPAGVPRTSAGQPPRSLPATAASGTSHTTVQPFPSSTTAASTVSASAVAGIASSRTTPPAQPPLLSSGAWAALALAALLVVLLVVQVVRPRRHRSPPRWQP